MIRMAGTPKASIASDASKARRISAGKSSTAAVPSAIMAVTSAVPQQKALRRRARSPAPWLKLITGRTPWIRPFTVMTMSCCTLKYAPKKATAVSE